KSDDFDHPGYRKYLQEAWLLLPRKTDGQIRLEVIADELEVVQDRTVSIDIGNSDMKAFRLPTRPATRFSLRGTYTDPAALDIEQLHFRYGLLNRRPLRLR